MEGASQLEQYLTRQRPLFKALTQLLHPFLEISIHKPETGEIVEIFHNLTKRKVGDTVRERAIESRFYFKRNGDRHALKCASLPIHDSEGRVIGIASILVDTSLFQETLQLFQSFVALPDCSDSLQMATEDCRSKIAQIIDDFLRRKNLSLAHLSRSQKRDAVQLLHEKGVFSYKNSVPEAAGQLRLSRATVYNYLKEI